MFRYIKKVFIAAMPFFSCNAPKFISMNNQECKVRLEVINIHNNEPSFYPYSVKISKCSGSCNNISDPYAKLCVPHISKNMSVKVFNLISRTNEARYMKQDGMRHVSAKVEQMYVFVIINNDGMKINADVNAKN